MLAGAGETEYREKKKNLGDGQVRGNFLTIQWLVGSKFIFLTL